MRVSALRRMVPQWLDRRALILVVIIAVPVLSYSVLRGATYHNDFKGPYRVARTFWQTGKLDIAGQNRYPPTVRVLLAPLAALPIPVAAAVWALGSLVAILSVPGLLERLSDVPVREQALAWLATLPLVIDALIMGQSDPINLFLVTAGLVLAREARPVLGAGLIGLAGMIKVLPLAFWWVLVVRRRLWGAVAGAILTLVASVVLLTGLAGWGKGLHSIVEWHKSLVETEGPWALVARDDSLRENNESLPVVLARTFGDLDPDLTRNAVPLAHLPLRLIWVLWMAILAVMAATWLACAWRTRRAEHGQMWLGMFGLTAALMLAATPIAWPHYFMWFLPAAVFLSHRSRVLVFAAILGSLGMMIPTLRGLGCHMLLALLFFAMVAYDLLRSVGRREWRNSDRYR